MEKKRIERHGEEEKNELHYIGRKYLIENTLQYIQQLIENTLQCIQQLLNI